MKKIKKNVIFTTLFIIFISALFSGDVKKIAIKKIFSLNPVMKKLNISPHFFTYPKYKSLFIDSKGNFYMVDRGESRIIKISHEGKLLKVIGHFGTDDPGLYFPKTMDIKGNRLYVLTFSIKHYVVKVFDLNGEKLLGKIDLGVKRGANFSSLMVDKNRLYTDLKTNNRENYKNKLIYVFDMNGKKINGFGKIIKAQSWIGNMMFSLGTFSKYKDSIIGAMWYYPVIVHYKVSGKEVYRKDLLKGDFPEIKGTQEFVIRNRIDRPDKRYSTVNGQISTVNFCHAADIDRELNLYYSTWELKEDLKAPVLPVVYKFDKNGKHVATFVFTLNDKPIKVFNLLIDREKGKRYGVGTIGSMDDRNLPLFVFEF